jgi:hypothetical protein
MKNVWKKLVCCGLLAALVLAGCSGESGSGKAHETKPLIEALDSANMMLVTPVGLGDRAKGKVISGRLYENFVQLLRLADADESLQDTFSTECATGLHIKLFKDTLSVAELRVAEKIGRVGDDVGVWTPKSSVTMARIVMFFRGQGINFRPCSVGSADLSEEDEDALAQLILSRDTAVGMPLYEMVKDADRVTIGFTEIIMHKAGAKKSEIRVPLVKQNRNRVELDSSQIQEFISLLRKPKKESFAGGCLCLSMANVTFYRDSSVIMSVKVIGNDFGQLEKHPLALESAGIWESADPQAMKAFFNRIKPQKEIPEETELLPIERPVLKLK